MLAVEQMEQTYIVDRLKVKRIMLDKWGVVEGRFLAGKVGVTEATMSRILGGYGFNPDTLYRLCMALEVGPEDILTIGPKSPTPAGVMA